MDAERMSGAGLLLSEGDLGRGTFVPGCDLGNSFRSLENGSMGFRARAIIREASSSHSPGPPSPVLHDSLDPAYEFVHNGLGFASSRFGILLKWGDP